MAIARSSVAVAVALALNTPLAAHAQSSPPSGEETPLPEVRVTADSGPNTSASTGALGDKPVLDTPFSIDVVDQESIENRQAITIGDVFKLDPSVTVFDDGYIGEASGIMIRGLQLDLLNGYKVDGLAIANWGSDLPVEHFQRIELLKGSGGFMYGFGSPGGIANFVLKRPTDEPLRSVTVGYMNDATLKGQVDLAGRAGEEKMFGYRINAVQEQGDTFVNDGGYIRRTSGMAAIDWCITPDLVWQADGLFQKRRVYAAYYGVVPYQDYGLPDDFLQFYGIDRILTPVTALPSPIKGNVRLAQPFTWHDTEFKMLGTSLNWAFAEDWNARLAYRWAEQNRTNYDSVLLLLDNFGNYLENQFAGPQRYPTQNGDAIITGKFSTGFLRHDVAFGAAWQELEQIWAGTFSQAFLGFGNIYQAPTNFPNPDQLMPRDLQLQSKTQQTSIFASDTINFTPQWSALLGLRYIDYRQDTFNFGGATYTANPVTPTAAIMYKPMPLMTIYASYVQALEQGGTAPLGTENFGQSLPPIKTHQYELGVKVEEAWWSTNAAVFQIKKGLEAINSVGVFKQSGDETYTGFEVAGRVRPTREWSLTAGLMYLNTENQSDDPLLDGKRAAGAPEFTALLYSDYAVPQVPGLFVNGGANFVSNRPLESNNQNFVPSYYTVDVGSRYITRIGNTTTTLRFNINNLLNEAYWLPSWGFILVQGAPRTFRLSAQFDF